MLFRSKERQADSRQAAAENRYREYSENHRGQKAGYSVEEKGGQADVPAPKEQRAGNDQCRKEDGGHSRLREQGGNESGETAVVR